MEMHQFSKKNWEDFGDWIQTTDPHAGKIKVPSIDDPRILEGVAVLDGSKLTLVADQDGVIIFVGEKDFTHRKNALKFAKEMPQFVSRNFLEQNDFYTGTRKPPKKKSKSKVKKLKKHGKPETLDLFHAYIDGSLISCQANSHFFTLTPQMLNVMAEKISNVQEQVTARRKYQSRIDEVKCHADAIINHCDDFLDDCEEIEDVVDSIKSTLSDLQETVENLDLY